MTGVTIIEFEGHSVGMVAGGHARINEQLIASDAMATIKGMALFALEVQGGNIDGPYTDERALAYAKQANGHRAKAGMPRPVRPGRG